MLVGESGKRVADTVVGVGCSSSIGMIVDMSPEVECSTVAGGVVCSANRVLVGVASSVPTDLASRAG